MISSLHARTLERLAEIRSAGLERRVSPPMGIDLSSNDYLGLARDERVKEALIEAVRNDSAGSTGSRLLRGHRKSFTDAERQFSQWKGTERSLFFSSGYQANLGALQTFVENTDLMFSDELNHASLIDGIRLTKAKRMIFKHADVDEVAKYLRNTSGGRQKFLITESLFSMNGDIAPLHKYAEICRETSTALIVDEAHAVGIFGRNGSGLIEEFGVEDSVFLSINTGGKALGVSGAFVAGSHWAVEYLLQKARPFIFSTAPPPAVPAALSAAIAIARSEPCRRERLFELTGYFRLLAGRFGLCRPSGPMSDRSPIVSVHVGDNARACVIASRLQSLGFDVRAIRPPTVAEGTARLRISMNITLTKEIVERFVDELARVMREEGADLT